MSVLSSRRLSVGTDRQAADLVRTRDSSHTYTDEPRLVCSPNLANMARAFTRPVLLRSLASSAPRVAETAASFPHFLWKHRAPPVVVDLMQPPSHLADDYVLPWPSSTVPRRHRPSVRADFVLDQPSSLASARRGAVAASYVFPFELLSQAPPAAVRRGAAAALPSKGSADWPASPPAAEVVAADYVYEWPSALPVRSPRPSVEEDFVYDWPSSAPVCTKPSPDHVMNWGRAAY